MQIVSVFAIAMVALLALFATHLRDRTDRVAALDREVVHLRREWQRILVALVADPRNPAARGICRGHPLHGPLRVMDADPDGLFEAFRLQPGAPVEALWDRMVASGFSPTQEAVFEYVRDNGPLYARCVV